MCLFILSAVISFVFNSNRTLRPIISDSMSCLMTAFLLFQAKHVAARHLVSLHAKFKPQPTLWQRTMWQLKEDRQPGTEGKMELKQDNKMSS